LQVRPSKLGAAEQHAFKPSTLQDRLFEARVAQVSADAMRVGQIGTTEVGPAQRELCQIPAPQIGAVGT
jgi:hypothetical protein